MHQPEPTPSVPSASTGVSLISVIIICLIVSAMASISSVYIYHENYAPRVMGVDMAKYTSSIYELVKKNGIESDEAKTSISELKSKIDALPPRYTAIMSDVLLGQHEEMPLPSLASSGQSNNQGGDYGTKK